MDKNPESLLVELFTEELPPKSLRRLGDAFALGVRSRLEQLELLNKESVTAAFASPRRLAVHISYVLDRARDRAEDKKLMPTKVGLDASGRPTEALQKRLAKDGIDVATAQLQRRLDGNNEFVYVHYTVSGARLVDALQTSVSETIDKLPIPKLMNYHLVHGNATLQFVRPAHGLVALHGATVVPIAALGLTAGRITQGHRLHGAPSNAL